MQLRCVLYVAFLPCVVSDEEFLLRTRFNMLDFFINRTLFRQFSSNRFRRLECMFRMASSIMNYMHRKRDKVSLKEINKRFCTSFC